MDVKDIIKTLELERHPEGGYYKRTYESDLLLDNTRIGSAIYYLLEGEDDIKFNLVGKREKNSDWFIKDIVLNIKNNKGKPTDFSIEKTIEFISKYVTLEVGDCIFTGTSGTAGQIKSGDEVIVDIENVGRLINRCI